MQHAKFWTLVYHVHVFEEICQVSDLFWTKVLFLILIFDILEH